jgi:alpha-amylase
MMHWSLFPGTFQAYEDFEHYLKGQEVYEDVHVFVRGGFWRNFLSKYSEVNNMHKKMLRVSAKYWSVPDARRAKLIDASDGLWAGQCNCPYWHGVFGGLYLSHLRDAIYSNLIKAEMQVDKALEVTFPRYDITDMNVDGYDEIAVETNEYNAYIHPGKGGHIYELDHKPTMKNVMDTMTRRREGYHHKLDQAVMPGQEEHGDKTASIHDLVLAKEPDLASKLHYDFYERKSFIEHFMAMKTKPESFAAAEFVEEGDFYNSAYEISNINKSADSIRISLERSGKITRGKQKYPIKITKDYNFSNNTGEISVNYNIKNLGKKPVKIWFGVELNFGLQAGHADDRYYYSDQAKLKDKYLDSIGKLPNIDSLGLRDEWRNLDILIKTDKKVDFWRCPVETISLSEAGFERVYQNSSILPNIQLNLEKNFELHVSLNMQKLK